MKCRYTFLGGSEVDRSVSQTGVPIAKHVKYAFYHIVIFSCCYLIAISLKCNIQPLHKEIGGDLNLYVCPSVCRCMNSVCLEIPFQIWYGYSEYNYLEAFWFGVEI